MKIDSNEQTQKRDPDFVNAEVAIKRAAIRAREIAKKTGTAIVTQENKKIREQYPGQEPPRC